MPEAVQKYEPFVGDQEAKPPWKKLSHDTWLLLFTAVYLISGMVYLHYHNGFTYMTAVYALVEIVTTIGYGDVNFAGYWNGTEEEDSDIGKIFMSFYVMVGLTVIAGVVMKVAEKATAGAEQAFRAKMRKAQMKASGLTEDQVKNKFGEKNKLLAAGMAFAAMILFGTVFYGTYESCTCSYGRTLATGCNPLNCETSGYKKTYIDAFYMSCITLTTVGFGDFAPKSYLGRGVGIVWMLLGVVVTGNFISEMTGYFIEAPPSVCVSRSARGIIYNIVNIPE
jgi:hypothetical protein